MCYSNAINKSQNKYGGNMATAKRKVGVKFVVILGLGLFLAGYVAGTFLPLPVFGDDSFIGAFKRPGPKPGPNTHRD